MTRFLRYSAALSTCHDRPQWWLPTFGNALKIRMCVFVVEPRDRGPGCDVGMHDDYHNDSGGLRGSRDVQCAQVTVGDGTPTFSGCGGYSDITVP